MSIEPQVSGEHPRARAHVLERRSLALPFWRYFELFRSRAWPFLLDSASDPHKLGRFSFMGSDPFLVFRAKRLPPEHGRVSLARCSVLGVRVEGGGHPTPTEYVANPFTEIRRLMATHAVDRQLYGERPVPLLAGAVGYLGFEADSFIEALPDTGRDDLGLPDVHLGFYETMLVHCHRTGISYVSALGRHTADATRKRDELLERIDAFERHPTPEWTGSHASVSGNLDTTVVNEADYCKLVERAKAHIFAGDLFELCLTHRMESPFDRDRDPWDLYRELRRINPSPFASFLPLPEATIVSSSPERFLKLGADAIAESRPIKGTRPRGETEQSDRALYADLQSSPKDQAENNMIVDLVRSDFGRVCRFGTVHVPELRIIERYATLYQMVSTIRGELIEGRDAIDLLVACFPGGSMTGAPKIEAIKIIDALEPVKRSVYSGAIGYLDFAGPMDLAIVIRTIIVKATRAFYNVGGAIVADSVAKDEYQETLDKARALMSALRAVGRS